MPSKTAMTMRGKQILERAMGIQKEKFEPNSNPSVVGVATWSRESLCHWRVALKGGSQMASFYKDKQQFPRQ